MKQLSNKTTQNVVRIVQIDSVRNSIVYATYEVIYYDDAGEEAKLFKLGENTNFSLKNNNYNIQEELMNNSFNIDDVYNIVKESLFPEYILDDANQNWLYESKPYRVIMHAKKSLVEKNTNTLFSQLYNALEIRHSGYIIYNDADEDWIIMYCDTRSEEEIAMLPDGAYGNWIFIEKKLN